MTRQIDVHHHVAAPEYIADLKLRKQNANMNVFYAHTPAKSVEDMDKGGTATSLLSVNNVWVGDDARAAKLARACNEYSAKLVTDHRGRFAMWGCLPLPVIDASLKEIEYSLDVLKADGVGMMTSYGSDKWLGDPVFWPVMDELNRRKAVVFVHPTAPDCCVNLVPGIPDPAIEFGTDTTRTIASLLFGGTLKRCPDIRFIFSHGGGTMPFLFQRFELLAKGRADKLPKDGLIPSLATMHYDCAISSNPYSMGPLAKLVGTGRIVFGSDYPFRLAKDHVDGLTECGFSAADIGAIHRGNMERLLPRLKS
jgi:predicted TIM-barrel fold metal-dependent hydrolase